MGYPTKFNKMVKNHKIISKKKNIFVAKITNTFDFSSQKSKNKSVVFFSDFSHGINPFPVSPLLLPPFPLFLHLIFLCIYYYMKAVVQWGHFYNAFVECCGRVQCYWCHYLHSFERLTWAVSCMKDLFLFHKFWLFNQSTGLLGIFSIKKKWCLVI